MSPDDQMNGNGPRVLDLCCGMGGLSAAAQKSGATIVGGVDPDANALETFRFNLPNAVGWQHDITQHDVAQFINENELAGVDYVVSGPPCQGFSVAGTRKEDDPRNKVLVATAEWIVGINPTGALVENVTGLLHERYKSIRTTFTETLETARYAVEQITVKASRFGVPQRRERVLFFVTRDPIEKDDILARISRLYRVPMTVAETIGDLPEPPVHGKVNGSTVIPNHVAMDHSDAVKDKIRDISPGGGPISYKKLESGGSAATLICGNRAAPVHYEQNRAITVREALRLQGFPDEFRVQGTFSNQMQQVVNSVPLPLGVAAFEVLTAVSALHRGA